MLTESQLTEIRNYLLLKKLPIDILLEVQDHFVSQIHDLKQEEHLTFEEAFERTKKSWLSEQKPYWDGGWDLFDKNNMVRKFERMLIWVTLKKSMIYALAFLAILSLIAWLLPLDIYRYFSLLILVAVTVYPIYNYFAHFRSFTLSRKYPDYALTLYQSFTFINFIFIFQFYTIFLDFKRHAEQFKQVITELQPAAYFFIFLIYFFVFVISFFALFSQQEYLKRMERVKPFLKYLDSK